MGSTRSGGMGTVVAYPHTSHPAAPRAVLDVGSNTIRLLVARPDKREITPLLSKGEFVQLGHGVQRTGTLCPQRADLAVRTIDTLAKEASRAGVLDISAVATAAVREARNGPAFVRAVEESTGVRLQVLSADREGELTFLGATLGVPFRGETIVVDLGGGSTEIVAGTQEVTGWACSLPIGSGRLAEQFAPGDPPSRRELREVRRLVTSLLDILPASKPGTLIFTGGTARQIARILGKRGTVVRVKPAALDRVARLLRDRSADHIVSRFGVRPERARVLPAGVKALQTIAAWYVLDEIVLTRRGIREGVIVDGLRREGEWPAA